MLRSILSSLSAVAFTSALVFSPQASAIEFCEMLFNVECTNGCYQYMSPGDQLRACDEPDAMVIVQDDVNVAPQNPSLQCKQSGNSYMCQAWPQGEELSYSWASEQSSQVITDVINPYRSFSCSGGVVTVAVASPAGAASLASITLPACD